MRNIFIMQSLLSLGNAFVGIFFPFLIMEKFGLSFSEILLFMGAEYGLMGLLVYPVHRLKLLSVQYKLAVGIFFLFVGMIFLSLVPENSDSLFLLLGLAGINSLSLAFLWPAFHWVNISLVSEKVRGKFLGNLQVIMMGSLLVGPFLSGWVIDLGLGDYILWGAGMFYFLSLLGALRIPVSKEKNPEISDFFKTQKFFKEQTLEKSFFEASVVEAVQTSSLMLVYPILLKISLKKYALMGGMFFLMAAVEMVSAKIVGWITDKYSSKKVMKWGAWARFLDIAPRGILAFFPSTAVASILSISAGLLGPLFGVSFYAQMYARAEKSGDVYTFIVTREWLLGMARFVFFIITSLGFHVFGIYTLALALFVAGFLSFFLRKM